MISKKHYLIFTLNDVDYCMSIVALFKNQASEDPISCTLTSEIFCGFMTLLLGQHPP